jgi:hypothetical protein
VGDASSDLVLNELWGGLDVEPGEALDAEDACAVVGFTYGGVL